MFNLNVFLYCVCMYDEYLYRICSYAFVHATRKAFSNVKSLLDDSWTPSNHSMYHGLYPPEV